MAVILTCRIPLPPGFRPRDILAFHSRDTQSLSESTTPASFRKGMIWDGSPACLSVVFKRGGAQAELAVDGDPSADSQARFKAMAGRMLGLANEVEAFERQYREHPVIGRLIAGQAGLRVPVAATPFEALTWAVTGQQVSVAAAVSIRRRLILALGRRHSGGLLCYPDPGQIAAQTPETLRQAGYSRAKADTLLNLARMIAGGQLPLDAWVEAVPVEDIRRCLLDVRGVGPWTVDYTLLRGFGWLDGSLHGDVAVRRGIQALTGAPEKISEKQAEAWLAEFSPWRAQLAAHLWASLSSAAY